VAESLDKQIAIADVYAEALFNLAREKKRVEEVRAELDELVKLEEIEPSFEAFMTSAALDDDYREAGLETMFRGKLSDDVLNTLLVMNEHGRYGMIEGLREAFARRQRDAANQVPGTVISAVELSPELKSQVERAAADISGKKPLLSFVVDPSILGGLIVQLGDWRYDNSVQRHLRFARRQMLERAQRGLPVGT
jgi:F-type H+-transporting ATPase subunit delta